MTSKAPWTPSENLALSRLYFDMLAAATSGQPYNKAAMIRHASRDNGPGDTGPLASRSRGSIESKLMNATACHAAIDPAAVTMDGYGYRALCNYQAALLDAMRTELHNRRTLQREEGADRRNLSDCHTCGQTYQHNNLSWHDAGYCSPQCRSAAKGAA